MPHLAALWLPSDQVGEISKFGSGFTIRSSIPGYLIRHLKLIIPKNISTYGIGQPQKASGYQPYSHQGCLYGLFDSMFCIVDANMRKLLFLMFGIAKTNSRRFL
jgi:hypothetical protein